MKCIVLVLVSGCWFAPDPPSDPVQRQWREVAATEPGPLYAPRLAYDPIRERVIMFGGLRALAAQSVTWAYDGAHWTSLCDPCAPSPRFLPAMAYDSRRKRVVMYGGGNATDPPSMIYDDAWELGDDDDWHPINVTGLPPLIGAALLDDTNADELVIVGGFESIAETRVFRSSDGEAWTMSDTGVASPPVVASDGVAAAFDPVRDRILALPDKGAGVGPNSTDVVRDSLWELDGTWTQLCGACGAPRTAGSIIYVPTDDRVYLATGYAVQDSVQGTWVLSDSAWMLIDTLGPSERDSVGMVYDSDRDLVVVYGGNGEACGVGTAADCAATLEYARP